MEGAICDCAWTPGGVVAVLEDGTLPGLGRHPGANRLLALGDDLLVGTLSGLLHVYREQRLVSTVRAHSGAIMGMAARGDYVYTVAADGVLRQWKIHGTPEEHSSQHTAPLLGLAVSNDAQTVALGADRSMLAFDTELQPYRMMDSLHYAAAISADGAHLATAGPDGVSVWPFPPPR